MPLVERRYAEALIRVGIVQKLVDTFQSDMEVVEEAIQQSSELKKVLNNPSLKKNSKKDAIVEIFGKDIHKDTMNFLKILVDKGRMKNFSGIKEQYKLLAEEVKRCLNIKVISAIELSESQLKKIGEKFKAQYGSKDVTIDSIIDPSIFGGVIVKIGDKMIDASVKTKLDGMLKAIN